jgi:DNA-binding CsgD family transcriptional regulator
VIDAPAVGSFVGRRVELDRFARALDAVRGGRPRILVVEGEPGIGKTAFLRRCVAQAEDFVVLEAAGDEAETMLDLGVIVELVARAPAGAPATGGDAGAPPSSFSAGADVLAVLGAAQDTGPVLVAIDDAQWIDAASAGALTFAVRRLHADRVCVLVATRPEEDTGTSWSRLLHAGDRVERIRLGGLDGREVGRLAGSLGHAGVTGAAAERLRAHTGGHPLYVRALLAELQPDALTTGHGTLPAPRSFSATVLARLAGVGPATEELIAAAAVAGPRCTLEVAGAVARLDDPLPALDAALAAGLLVRVPARVPAEIAFPHPLLRAAVYDDLSPTRRRDLHLACAGRTAGATSLMHRVSASPGTDDALAAELVDAGEAEIGRGRIRAAVELLLLASRVAGDLDVREAALLQAVDCLGVAGDVPRAQSLRDEVAACRESARRSFVLATLTASGGRLPEALDALVGVAERPDFAAHPELHGPVISSLAIVSAYAGQGEEAVVWADRALAGDPPSPTVLVTAREARALGLAIAGRAREAVADLGDVSPSHPAPEPFEAELLATRGGIRAWCGDLTGAVEDLVAVVDWARAGALPRSLANAYASLADVEYRLGRWDDGLAHADIAVSIAQDGNQLWELPIAHAVASGFYAGRGEWTLAEEHLDGARAALATAALPLSLFFVSLATARLAALRGNWEAVPVALAIFRARGPAPASTTIGQRLWDLLAEAWLRLGRLEDAERLLARWNAPAFAAAHAATQADVWRLRGELAAALGDAGEAGAAFGDAEAAAAASGSGFAAGVVALSHGMFLRRARRRGAAAERLGAARERFERLGARPWLERCDAELAACGMRTSGASERTAGLTAREQAVAALVVAGRSNREAGAELYLSTKAIEYHLGNIFTKLGVRSRHELAARLRA